MKTYFVNEFPTTLHDIITDPDPTSGRCLLELPSVDGLAGSRIAHKQRVDLVEGVQFKEVPFDGPFLLSVGQAMD